MAPIDHLSFSVPFQSLLPCRPIPSIIGLRQPVLDISYSIISIMHMHRWLFFVSAGQQGLSNSSMPRQVENIRSRDTRMHYKKFCLVKIRRIFVLAVVERFQHLLLILINTLIKFGACMMNNNVVHFDCSSHSQKVGNRILTDLIDSIDVLILRCIWC